MVIQRLIFFELRQNTVKIKRYKKLKIISIKNDVDIFCKTRFGKSVKIICEEIIATKKIAKSCLNFASPEILFSRITEIIISKISFESSRINLNSANSSPTTSKKEKNTTSWFASCLIINKIELKTITEERKIIIFLLIFSFPILLASIIVVQIRITIIFCINVLTS